MIKQYRINSTVEAVRVGFCEKEELDNFIGDQLLEAIWGDWVVKTITGDIVIIPNHTFKVLYSEVFE